MIEILGIKIMSSKDVAKEEEKKINEKFKDNFFIKFAKGQTKILGFNYETLSLLSKAAFMKGKNPNNYVLDLLKENKND